MAQLSNNKFNNTQSSVNPIVCKKCKSTHIIGNKRGYSFVNMFQTFIIFSLLAILFLIGFYLLHMYVRVGSSIGNLAPVLGGIGFFLAFLTLPVSIIVGFVGRNDVINACMNCGNKWRPTNKKK